MYIDTIQLGEIKPCLYYSQVYDNNFYMNMHQHKTLEIMYVSNGSMCITTVNSNNTEQDITVFQGEFVIIKENLLHKLSIPRNAVILNVEFESFSTNKSIDELFFYNSIASSSRNVPMSNEFTVNELKTLGFKWTKIGLKYLSRMNKIQ